MILTKEQIKLIKDSTLSMCYKIIGDKIDTIESLQDRGNLFDNPELMLSLIA